MIISRELGKVAQAKNNELLSYKNNNNNNNNDFSFLLNGPLLPLLYFI